MPKHYIRIAGLKEGEHRQAFEIKDKFFEAYEQSEVKTGSFIVNTLVMLRGLDRKLTINIEGTITNLLCDYCAQKLEWPISITSNFVIKESEKETESTDEVIYVLPNQYQLQINQLIFEMINLSIPSKRTHTKSEQGEGKCDKEMLELMEKYATKTKQEIDPRWEVLNKLK
jgi:uncharacterized metal-binding protein YceD (DUF177 family)